MGMFLVRLLLAWLYFDKIPSLCTALNVVYTSVPFYIIYAEVGLAWHLCSAVEFISPSDDTCLMLFSCGTAHMCAAACTS